MKCNNCNYDFDWIHLTEFEGEDVCLNCLDLLEAERSGVLQGCLTSATCSAEARVDARNEVDELARSFRANAEPSGTEASPGQWIMHVLGPDDIYPEVDELSALRHANKLNVIIAEDRRKNANDPHNPWAMAVVRQKAGTQSVTPTALPPQGERALARNNKVSDSR